MSWELPRGSTLPDARFRSRHRWMLRAVWAHAAVLPVVALLYGFSLPHALLEGAIVALCPLAATVRPLGRSAQVLLAALGLLTCSAVLVHVTGGLIEAHFHFFVVVTALSLYEDWRVFGVAIAYVLVHHGVGAAVFHGDVFAHAGDPWMWAGIHTAFIGALSVVNLVVWRSSEQARAELAAAHAELERRALDLERSNADLAEVAYVASHDLSEPLRMITSYLQLLQRRYGERLDEDADQFIAFAVDGAARMRALIEDLLLYSRVERDPPPARTVDTAETVDATLRALAAAIADADAEVRVGQLPAVPGDPVQLGQLFQNLIANALKFRAGDRARVEVGAERMPGAWRFTVADDGIGIDPEHADRVFKMFQRLHTREVYDGNGIGLAICRRIVDRHGGEIWVEPNPGGGSRFIFTIADEPAMPGDGLAARAGETLPAAG